MEATIRRARGVRARGYLAAVSMKWAGSGRAVDVGLDGPDAADGDLAVNAAGEPAVAAGSARHHASAYINNYDWFSWAKMLITARSGRTSDGIPGATG